MESPHLTPGRPILSALPSDLVGDVLEVWGFLNRFYEVLGIGSPLSIEEFEEGLMCPIFDDSGRPPRNGEPSQGANGAASHTRTELCSNSRGEGMPLNKVHYSLLKVLIGELQPKVAAIVRHNIAEKSKLQKTKKKNSDQSIAKDTKMSMPVNELNWQYLARRYILAVLSMDRSSGPPEIAFHHSGNAFCCLPDDGPNANMLMLCGSLTGVVGMEADASLLAQAMRKIFGPLDRDDDMLFIPVEVPNICGEGSSVNSSSSDLPRWAQLLIPVRKAPTNRGARIRNCVRGALKEDPPEWAKEKLQYSISKDVYVGNASGPTKRAVKEVLKDVCGEDKQESYKGKKKNYACISDLVMKKCRLVLHVASANKRAKLFYNSLRGQLLDCNDVGILGAPAVASRPLDFRTIDTRLALGAYDGSHEAFFEDIKELWNHIRVVYHRQPDLLRLADKFSSDFEDLYKKEVLHLRQKLSGYAKLGCLTEASKKLVDDILDCSSKLPKSPWEVEICKVCGIDEDDAHVLLCDGPDCNGAYHTYCLNPPVLRILEGEWFCPSCTGKNCNIDGAFQCPSVYVPAQRKSRTVITHLASALAAREYGQLSVEERISLLKFLCDELLDTDFIRKHTKFPLRRELLGRDSTGRLYWMLGEQGRYPWIIVSIREKEKKQEGEEMMFDSRASSDSEYPALLSYQSGEEVNKLLEYLKDDDPVERELKDSILRLDLVIEDVRQSKRRIKDDHEMAFSGWESRLYCQPQDTKAFRYLENEFGPWHVPESIDFSKKQERMVLCAEKYFFRCSCWELIWTSRHHCLSCHRTFPTSAKLESHNDSLCKLARRRVSKKKKETEVPNVKGDVVKYTSEVGSSLAPQRRNKSVEGKDEDLVTGEFLTIPKVTVEPVVGKDEDLVTGEFFTIPNAAVEPVIGKDEDLVTGEFFTIPNAAVEPVVGEDEDLLSGKFFTIPKAAVEPVVGKDAVVIQELKVNLLDIDAALPEGALRPWRANIQRRWAWRAFVKSAKTIYEVVQAIVVYEDTIRSDYFIDPRSYCSSVSAACNISTVAALALRIALLDASICYEKKPSPKQADGPDNKPKPLKRKRGQKHELVMEDGQSSGNN